MGHGSYICFVAPSHKSAQRSQGRRRCSNRFGRQQKYEFVPWRRWRIVAEVFLAHETTSPAGCSIRAAPDSSPRRRLSRIFHLSRALFVLGVSSHANACARRTLSLSSPAPGGSGGLLFRVALGASVHRVL